MNATLRAAVTAAIMLPMNLNGQVNRTPGAPQPVVDLFTCSFVGDNDMVDLLAVVRRWNEWSDRHEGTFSGFVDCGRFARADRYQDLAVAFRSIESNFAAGLGASFLDAYGLDHVDADKLAYYQLLDEFF